MNPHVIWSVLCACLISGCTSIKRPFLYEIEKNHQTSFVLGTVHVGVEASELPDFVHDALRKSRIFLSEINDEVLSKSDSQILQKSRMSDLRENEQNKVYLSSRLRPETWNKLRHKLALTVPTELKNRIEYFSPELADHYTQSDDRVEEIRISRNEAYRIENAVPMDFELYWTAKKQGKFVLPVDRSRETRRTADLFYLNNLEMKFGSTPASKALNGAHVIRAYREGDAETVYNIQPPRLDCIS